MADRIKGITVEIGGDTTKLSKALSGVNKEIRNTQLSLKDVNSLLKMDPGNTELLKQKQLYLKDAIEKTEEKLKAEKAAMEQLKNADSSPENAEQQRALAREIEATSQELKKLNDESKEFGSVFSQKIKLAAQAVGELGEKMQNAGAKITDIGKKVSVASAAVVGLGTTAVKTAADFDTSMSKVSALSGATGDELEALRDKAKEMGKSTKFSASESADAFSYMALAGWDTKSMLDGIEPILNLAAAAEMDLAQASDIVTDYLTAFGLGASDAEKFTDQLAYAMANSNTDVTMLGEAYKNCAATAASMGYSVEDTTAVLMTMANAGVKGGEAGSGLSAIMTRLATDTKGCASALAEYGINVYDEQGNMNSLSSILEGMSGIWADLTDEEQANLAKTIAGTSQYSKLQTIMSGLSDSAKESGMSFTDYAKALSDCDGAASEMASVMQDNLNGQLTTLKSSLEGLSISFGEMLMPYIQKAVTFIQNLVDKLNAMDEGQRTLILTIGAIIAAAGPVLIVIGNVVSAIGTIMTIVPTLVAGITTVATAVAGFSATLFACPLTWIIAAIVAVIAIGVLLYKNWDVIKEKAAELWAKITEVFDSIRESISTAVTNIKLRVTEAFDNVKAAAAEKFNAVKSSITDVMGGVSSVVQGKLANIKNAFETNGGGIKGVVAAGWTAIKEYYSTGFQALNALTGGKLGEIANAFKSKFKELASSAVSWGRDIIQGIVDGITGMIDKVKDAASKVAGAISDFLHFSEPDKGPLSNFHTFMPDMIALMVKGINDSMDQLKAPVANLSASLVPNTDTAVQTMTNSMMNGMSALENTLGGYFTQSRDNQEVSVNVILEGDAAGVFRLVRQENTKFVKTTGFNPLMT